MESQPKSIEYFPENPCEYTLVDAEPLLYCPNGCKTNNKFICYIRDRSFILVIYLNQVDIPNQNSPPQSKKLFIKKK
ncbi:hypothetical protein BpHYR1_006911 [Brachionus plicatilis]|uniref:Uncharacterized protein n=1 Tax=Brachionus plicatilis TaxID=10195 RepID=A0A3M7QS85_BRAPC|nr:hypothetical protein BpHYR1_006911 [Brachionus plicatilis]